MLALLAIEQVTQPVVAGQAVLLNSTSAGGDDKNDAELEDRVARQKEAPPKKPTAEEANR
jgi:hypothetical protein